MAPAARPVRYFLASKKPTRGRPPGSTSSKKKKDPDYVPSASERARMRTLVRRKRTRTVHDPISATFDLGNAPNGDEDVREPVPPPHRVVPMTKKRRLLDAFASVSSTEVESSSSSSVSPMPETNANIDARANTNDNSHARVRVALAVRITPNGVSKKMATYNLPPRKRHDRLPDRLHLAAVAAVHQVIL